MADKQTEEYVPYEPESQGSKLAKKLKDSPFASVGIVGGSAVLGYMLYSIKNRKPNTKLSLQLIQTRLAVQGTVVGAMTIGMMYYMYQRVVDLGLYPHSNESKSSKGD